MPDNYCETPQGLLLIANGMQRMLRWDGLDPLAGLAGLSPPLTAPSLSGSGAGAILGQYFAFQRFLDKDGNFSNFSPVSAEFDPVSSTGAIANITNQTPLLVTTAAAHGLSSGSTVLIAGVGGTEAANNTWTITVVDGLNFLLNDSVSDNAYTGGGSWTAGVATITYSNVELPQEVRAVRRQLLRNTNGQGTTFYVDVDTTDLIATTFSSSNVDSVLATHSAQTLLDARGNPLADAFTVPPSHKKVIVSHNGRVFAGVDLVYTEGNVSVSLGSTAVQGIGTEWTQEMAGRFLYTLGATQAYQIATVNAATQTLTLLTPYLDLTAPYARYAIRPAPAEKRLIYYSEAGLPEAWPAINALSVPEDGDELTAMAVNASYLWIMERRHVYRFTFQSDPAQDGFVFLASASRGCLNQRCWVRIEDTLYMMDEQGCHAFDGGGAGTEPISAPIQDIFRANAPPYEINWQQSDYFHAVHYPTQEVVRWFVCLSGCYLPRHALAYNYRLKRWWIEEFAQDLGASCQANFGGQRSVLLGSNAAQVLLYWQGNLDGPDPSAGTVRGQVTGTTRTSLTDARASFAAAGLVNAPLLIVDGTGKGQRRKVVAVSGQTLTVDGPWGVRPDTSSVYQLGGIPWLFKSGWYRFMPDENNSPRRIEVVVDPITHAGLLNIRLFRDFESRPIQQARSFSSADADGVRTDANSPWIVCDLTKPTGHFQKRMSGHKELYADGVRYWALEISGVTNQDDVTVGSAKIEGTAPNVR